VQNLKTDYLSNKLPVYHLKTTKAPVVTLQVWVKTGSADELKSEAGLSHFIEHLVFKGTDKFAPGEIAQVVEAAGGELNAYTSFDQTVFYVTVPKHQFEVAARVLSEMLIYPKFDPTEVDNEREVVVEEIKMGLDQPGRVSSKMLFDQMFKGHPYALPVIGTEENIRRVPVDEIKNYFGERYTGHNMSLVCVGDIEDEHLEILETYFKDLKFEGLKKQDRKRTPVLLSKDFVSHQKSEFEKDYFYISWPMKGYKSSDSETAELLSLLLGQGESSFLYDDLKLKKGLCRSIGASYFGGDENGIFVVSGVTIGDEIEALAKELPKSIEAFLKQSNIRTEILKARNIFDSEAAYSEESISSLCRNIGDDWLYYNRVGVTEEKKDRILNLDERDLKTFAKKIFSVKPYLSVLSKDDMSETLKSLPEKLQALSKVEPQFKAPTEADKLEKVEFKKTTKIQKKKTWTTDRGSQVVFVPESVGSVVSVKIAFEGGELLTSDQEQGLVSLFGDLWGREFTDLSEKEVAAKMDFYCSSFNAFSGKHSVGLSLSTLSKYFDELSPFFAKSIDGALFSEEVLNREKLSLISQLKSRVDRPSAVAFQEFSKLIFKDHIYSRDSIGVVEHIENITTASLEKYLEQILSQRCVFSFVGDLEESQVKSLVEDFESKLKAVGETLLASAKTKKPNKGAVLKEESDKNQSHIIIGYPAYNFKDDKKLHMDLVSALLGGQGGRLFIELRDKASLAYSVAPLDYAGLLGGYFGGYIACDPSKRETAISMMKVEFVKTTTSKFTSDEMAWMKNQVVGKFAMSSQRNSFISDTVLFDALYGLDPFEYETLEKRIDKITAEDLQNTMKEVLSGPEFIVSVG
jgi:zinc protease